jgi:hypothetical protein
MPPLEVKNNLVRRMRGQKDMEFKATVSTWVGTIIRQLSQWRAICRRFLEHLFHPTPANTPFIKSCSGIAWILLRSCINVHFAVVILTPLNFFATVDLDSDYYSSRCKDINGL